MQLQMCPAGCDHNCEAGYSMNDDVMTIVRYPLYDQRMIS
jgi:hypothetical protein